MNYKSLAAPLAALIVFSVAGCASTAQSQQSAAAANCSKSRSAANNADCSPSRDLGPPVVDITQPAPAPGIASPQ